MPGPSSFLWVILITLVVLRDEPPELKHLVKIRKLKEELARAQKQTQRKTEGLEDLTELLQKYRMHFTEGIRKRTGKMCDLGEVILHPASINGTEIVQIPEAF